MRSRLASAIAGAVLGAGLMLSAPAQALCPDSGAVSNGGFITDLCWTCMFPIRFSGVNIGGSHTPDDTASPICVCPSAALFGFPTPGFTLGMWKPTHIVETVRQPGCFPSIGSETGLASVQSLLHGGGEEHEHEAGYHSTHVLTFPVSAITDMLTSSACTTSSSYDIDILSISEIDPTHSDAELSMVVNPEAVLFANPIAQAVCIADAVAATAYKPLLFAFWCMGSWGNTYPLSGYSNTRTQVQGAGLNGARAVATMHKRFMGNLHYGNSAVCSSHAFPTYPKQQYRWQNLYPMPQRSKNEWTGEATILNREWRHIPVTGEDWVQIMSTYEECCANYP